MLGVKVPRASYASQPSSPAPAAPSIVETVQPRMSTLSSPLLAPLSPVRGTSSPAVSTGLYCFAEANIHSGAHPRAVLVPLMQGMVMASVLALTTPLVFSVRHLICHLHHPHASPTTTLLINFCSNNNSANSMHPLLQACSTTHWRASTHSLQRTLL